MRYHGITSKMLIANLAAENMQHLLLTQDQKFRLINNMQRYGGNFISSLAQAMIAADSENFQILCDAFPVYVEKYLNITKK